MAAAPEAIVDPEPQPRESSVRAHGGAGQEPAQGQPRTVLRTKEMCNSRRVRNDANALGARCFEDAAQVERKEELHPPAPSPPSRDSSAPFCSGLFVCLFACSS